MTEQEINQICDRCNQYISENYHGKVTTFAEMTHFVHSEKTLRLNPGIGSERSYCNVAQALISVKAAVVYRRNGTSANTSIRVEVRHYPCKMMGLAGWQQNVCLSGIKFSASLKWPSIQKKLDSMIAVAMENQDLICIPEPFSKVSEDGTQHDYITTQDLQEACKWAADHVGSMETYSRTQEEELKGLVDELNKYLGSQEGRVQQ